MARTTTLISYETDLPASVQNNLDQMINAAILNAIDAVMRENLVTTDEPVTIKNASLLRSIANLETWEEHCRAEAIDDVGATTEAEVENYTRNASPNSDWTDGQEEAMNSTIYQLRSLLDIEIDPLPLNEADPEDEPDEDTSPGP